LLERALARYKKAKEWLWVQEESLNMGGWTFVEPRLRGMGIQITYVGRDSSASPATGSRQIHLREQRELVEAALGAKAPHLVRSTVDGKTAFRGGDSVMLRADAAQVK
jgi:2-oxoglutarate dehydrogenase E1 component